METKVCTTCKKEKSLSEFCERKDRPCGYTAGCKRCLAVAQRNKYKNKDQYRLRQKEWSKTTYRGLKAAVVAAYGGHCSCCGETEPRFLTIDHINGNGAEARRNGEGLGGSLYLRLKRLGFPKDNYQLLCFNCNCSKRQFGVCPHEEARLKHTMCAD